jgi:Sel1 repeat-containing protein
MRAPNVIEAPTSRWRAETLKSGFSIGSLALLSLCIWMPRLSVADCAPELHAAASLPKTRPSDGGEFDQPDLRALNLLGIRYAKGQGVKKNPGLAMRFFLRSALQGYTPAMANLGTLYGIGATKRADFRRAYAWVRAALSFGVPEEDHDATVLKLGMIAARLGSDRIESAERLAEAIATRIVDSCKCSPGQETELASNGSI